jgi:hypothetical protein
MSPTLVVDALGSPSVPPRGPAIDVSNIGVGRAPKSPTAPPRGPAIDVFDIGGGRSRVSDSTSQGAAINISHIGGGSSQVSNNTSHGGPPRVCNTRGTLPHQLPSEKFQVTGRDTKKLAPPTGSQPPLRWARGPLSVPYKPGTPAYRLQVKIRRTTCIHALPCVLQLQTSPPAEVGSSAATCPTALNLSSLLRQALMLPCVPQPRTLPPY